MSATTPPRTDTAPAPAMPRTAGHTGNVWSQDYQPRATPTERGGYGVLDRDDRPGAYGLAERETGGDDMTWRDAQYGASPLRGARYADDHQHESTAKVSDNTDVNRQRPGFENEESQSDLPGQGKDERGRYGQAPAENTQPEDYGSNTATNGNRL
ncbi:hypothetical protein [Asticcacaulis solisilvae]|uniref:hypothetical protein n=1 Tax=Asticcacaulis solisilvae TaxID=1217274 RepID=UPI003FD75333